MELIDVCLLAKKIQVNPAVLYGHAQMLKDVHAVIRVIEPKRANNDYFVDDFIQRLI